MVNNHDDVVVYSQVRGGAKFGLPPFFAPLIPLDIIYRPPGEKLATFINNIQSRELVHMTDLGSYRVSNETWELSKHFNNVFKPSGIFSWKIIVAVFQFKIKYRKHLALSFSKCGLRFLYLQNWRRHFTFQFI